MSTYLVVVMRLVFEPSSLIADDVQVQLVVTFEEILVVRAFQESKSIINFLLQFNSIQKTIISTNSCSKIF